jgi:hypothetical protein
MKTQTTDILPNHCPSQELLVDIPSISGYLDWSLSYTYPLFLLLIRYDILRLRVVEMNVLEKQPERQSSCSVPSRGIKPFVCLDWDGRLFPSAYSTGALIKPRQGKGTARMERGGCSNHGYVPDPGISQKTG